MQTILPVLDLTLLEDYFERNGFKASLAVDLSNPRRELIVRLLDGGGNDRVVILPLDDIPEILKKVEISGPDGRLERERAYLEEIVEEPAMVEGKMERLATDLIYHALAGHVARLFGARNA